MTKAERQRKADHKARKARGRAQAKARRADRAQRPIFIGAPGLGAAAALTTAIYMMGERR